MATWAIRVDMPPKGVLEEGGGGHDELTDEAMAEEMQHRKDFLDFVRPKLAELVDRPARRSANVVRAEIHGADTWSNLNHYLLLVSVDISGPGFEPKDVVPRGAKVEVIGAYDLLETVPADKED